MIHGIKEKNMIDYKFDQKTQQIYKTSENKKDMFFTLLSEGRLMKRAKYYRKKFFTNIRKGYERKINAMDEWMGYRARLHMMKDLKIVPNRIVFAAFQGNYACNCKYIAEKIIERGLDYEMIFIVDRKVYENKKLYQIPPQIRLVVRNTQESFYALGTAKFWFDNALICPWKKIPKKPEQIYINTWHGSLGIKKLSGDDNWQKIARDCDQMIDYFLTDSVFDEHVFTESFWPNVKHLKVGHPRNDIFFDEKKMEKLRNKVYKFYHIPKNAKTVLYAPTFRDNKADASAINVDFIGLKEALEKRFGGEWVVLSRLHFHNAKNKKTKDLFSGAKVIDASEYLDMQELMAAVDVGITDYSSWIFDYLFTGRPAFIYAADIEKYVNDRGFYYPLTETPFAIADSNETLEENIKAFDEADFAQKVEEFLKGKGCYEDGKACDRVVDFIEEHTKKN
jgi:CDP-glycerol glycerophosphotransferase